MYSGMGMNQSVQQYFSFELSGAISELDELASSLKHICSILQIPEVQENQLNLILEELYSNSVNYAFAKVEQPKVIIEITKSDNQLEVIYRDNGPEFNPLDKQLPNLDLSLEDRPIGGLGIFFVKSMTDNVSYRYEHGFNLISMTKQILPV